MEKKEGIVDLSEQIVAALFVSHSEIPEPKYTDIVSAGLLFAGVPADAENVEEVKKILEENIRKSPQLVRWARKMLGNLRFFTRECRSHARRASSITCGGSMGGVHSIAFWDL